MGSLMTIQNSNSHTTSQDSGHTANQKYFILNSYVTKFSVTSAVPYSPLFDHPAQSWNRFFIPTNFHDQFPKPFPNQKVTALITLDYPTDIIPSYFYMLVLTHRHRYWWIHNFFGEDGHFRRSPQPIALLTGHQVTPN